MTTTQTQDQPYPSSSMSFGVAQARMAELRTSAEHARQVRTARGPRRAPAWPAGVAVALRDTLAGALPASRSAARRQTCTTC